MDLLATSSDEDVKVPMPIRPRNFRLRQYFKEIEFQGRFCLTRTQAEDLLQLIGQRLDSLANRSNPLSPIDTLLCALRFYVCGNFYCSCGDGQRKKRPRPKVKVKVKVKKSKSFVKLKSVYFSFTFTFTFTFVEYPPATSNPAIPQIGECD